MTELKDSNRESAFNIAYYDYTVTKDLVPKKGHFPLCLCRSDMEFPDKTIFFMKTMPDLKESKGGDLDVNMAIDLMPLVSLVNIVMNV